MLTSLQLGEAFVAPKAYDYEPVDYSEFTESRFSPANWSITEWIAIVSLFYILCITLFAAGYFSSLPGNFIELFSLADLIGSNIPVLQYFLSVFFAYCLLWYALGWLIVPWWGSNKDRIEHNLSIAFGETTLLYLVSGLLVLGFILASAIVEMFEQAPLTLRLLPHLIFHGLFIYLYFAGYKYDVVSLRTLGIVIAISIVTLPYSIGRVWSTYDRAVPTGAHAIYLENGLCQQRKILRTGASGYLFYNPALKSFEFRPKEQIKAIYESSQCP